MRDVKALDDLFGELIELQDPAAQQAFLDRISADDPALRERLHKLLEAHEKADSFLQDSQQAESTEAFNDDERLGTQIGPYKLLQRIGEGGMGVVFMAEQKTPIKRRVALKIIKPGMDSRQVIARFEAERQALAMMDHPNIAKVLETGSTKDQRPYFVMELVKGIPITDFCDQHKLPTHERLRLFIDVCNAVHHAHQKGIIHRDLKPSNVLVAKFDDKPTVKVIDFGVAKATNQELTERTMFTQFGQIVGTLEYMSPEQAQFNQLDIDTRSDVYSLGVLLYELLTGGTPFDRQRLRSAAFDEVLRIIREEEPPKPSVRLSSSQTLRAIAENRQLEPKRLGGLVKGDLDWIVMKAIEKERSRRYDSANRFAEDIKRHLSNDLVEARPPSFGYQLRKFYARNRQLAIGGLVGFGLLSIGLTVALISRQQLAAKNMQLLDSTQQLERAKLAANAQAHELQKRLDEIGSILFDRAMDAAFSGDLEVLNAAIEQAERARSGEDLTESLRGIALLIAGDPASAIKRLESAVSEQAESATAQAALCWAYLHVGDYGMHETTQDKVQALLRQSANHDEYTDLFVLLTEYVDGDIKQLEARLRKLDQLIERKRHWGVAYIIRSRILGEIAEERWKGEERALALFADAVTDFEKAYQQLGASGFTINEGLHVYTKAIDLAKHFGVGRPDWISRTESLIDELRNTQGNNWGMHVAAGYFFTHSDKAIARQLESDLILQLPADKYPYAAEVLQFDISNTPPEWESESDDMEIQLCYAMSLACSARTPQEKANVRDFVYRLFPKETPVTWYSLAVDVACVLGDADMLRALCEKAKAEPTYKREWRWYRYYLDYHGGFRTQEELIDLAGPFSRNLSFAYYGIGLTALLKRDRETALQFFRKAESMGIVTTFPYHNSKLLIKKLEEGWLEAEFPAVKGK